MEPAQGQRDRHRTPFRHLDPQQRVATGCWFDAGEARWLYHDGRFPTLLAVVNHYNAALDLALTEAEKHDVVEYVKSLH